jgi:slime mold repeat-containing protein
MNTIPSDCRSNFKRVLFSALVGAAFALFLWPIGESHANVIKCYCHNICHDQVDSTNGTQCTSDTGQQQGHQKSVNCHDCLVDQDLSCDPNKKTSDCFDGATPACENGVEDTLGKCNGCGDGVVNGNGDTTVEQCDDGNNQSGDGCSADCKTECQTNDECDNHIFCDGVETCHINPGDEFGSCLPGPGDPCVGVGNLECNNVCNEESRTCHTPAGTGCKPDTNQCTDDVCNGQGDCIHPATDGKGCDDKNPCTQDDKCTGDSCGGTAVDCSNDVTCDIDSCIPDPQNPNVPLCKHDPSTCHCTKEGDPICNDNNPCTDDSCDIIHGACVFTPNNNNTPCNDGMFCNGDDTCSGGTCSQHSGNPCTTECNNNCTNDPQSCASPQGTQCKDDGNPCTDDVCDGGNSEGQDGKCVNNANVAHCSDNNVCTVNDVCADSACSSGGPLDCNDQDPCTTDSCDPQNGCSRVDNGTCGGAVVPNPPPPTFLSGAPPGNGCGHSLQGQYTSSTMELQYGAQWFALAMIMAIPMFVRNLRVWGKSRK